MFAHRGFSLGCHCCWFQYAGSGLHRLQKDAMIQEEAVGGSLCLFTVFPFYWTKGMMGTMNMDQAPKNKISHHCQLVFIMRPSIPQKKKHHISDVFQMVNNESASYETLELFELPCFG
jgi:hypothetical protein